MRVGLLASLFFWVGLQGLGASQFDSAGDREAIMRLIADFTKAENDRNPQAIAALFAEGPVFYSSLGGQLKSRAAIVNSRVARTVFDEKSPVQLKVEEVQFLQADVALVYARRSYFTSARGPVRSQASFLLIKTGKKWQIVSLDTHDCFSEATLPKQFAQSSK